MTKLTFISRDFQCHLDCEQCDYVTPTGQRCRRRVCVGVPTCWQHTIRKYGIKSSVSTIPGAGRGLFATRDFARWDWICPYIGENISIDCLRNRYGLTTAPYAADALPGQVVDSACRRGIAALANGHFTQNGVSRSRRSHNAGIEWRDRTEIWFRASRTIRQGEEIFVHYGGTYRLGDVHVTKRKGGADNRPC
jgi:hypothetical protein